MRLVDDIGALEEPLRDASRVFIAGGSGHPDQLAMGLANLASRHAPLEVVTSILGPIPPYCSNELAGSIRVSSFRATTETREAMLTGLLDLVPTAVSAAPRLLSDRLRPDVAMVKVSEPDSHGWCSLGPSVLYTPAAVEAARFVVAEVGSGVEPTFGDGFIHESRIDLGVRSAGGSPSLPRRAPTDAESAAALYATRYIEDGAVIQLGLGSVSEAVAYHLRDRRGLRIHAGLLGDSVLALLESGAILEQPAAVTAGTLVGSPELYAIARLNPLITVRRAEYTHSPSVLAGLKGLVSVNGAIEVDATGQVSGESIGPIAVSGPGGALDFAVGARTAGGISIVVLTSKTRAGSRPRIVRQLRPGTVVTVPRTEIDVVVTEYGAADLRGLGLRARRDALRDIGLEGEPDDGNEPRVS